MNIKEHIEKLQLTSKQSMQLQSLLDLQQRAADRANSDAEEIERLHEIMRQDTAERNGYLDEIERLKSLLSHWYECWNDGIPNPDGDVLDDTVAALAGKEKENV